MGTRNETLALKAKANNQILRHQLEEMKSAYFCILQDAQISKKIEPSKPSLKSKLWNQRKMNKLIEIEAQRLRILADKAQRLKEKTKKSKRLKTASVETYTQSDKGDQRINEKFLQSKTNSHTSR